MTRGIFTTEFLLCAVVVVAGIYYATLGWWGLVASALAAVGYAMSRGSSKGSAVVKDGGRRVGDRAGGEGAT